MLQTIFYCTLNMLSVGSKSLHVHQETAINWMIEREEDGGGLLCDEMGLGKTFTTVGLLLNKPVATTLILGPLAVLDQWAAVIKTTALALYLVIGGCWKHVSGKPIRGRVYITNYDKLISSPSLFDQPWARLICDEAHIMRNYKSKKYEMLKSLSVKRKWFLSGTPIVNRIQDLAALIHMINKTNPKTATTEKGIEWMEQYALQRTVEQIREALPNVLPVDPIVHKHRLDFASEEEAIFYRGIQGHIAAALENIMSQDRMDMIMFLGMIIRLRQLSTHPQVYIQSRRRQLGRTYLRPDWTGPSTKTTAIMNIIRGEEKSHGFVIFCHFNDEIEVCLECKTGWIGFFSTHKT
jgi:SNF2 family DNA or RNA helicase